MVFVTLAAALFRGAPADTKQEAPKVLAAKEASKASVDAMVKDIKQGLVIHKEDPQDAVDAMMKDMCKSRPDDDRCAKFQEEEKVEEKVEAKVEEKVEEPKEVPLEKKSDLEEKPESGETDVVIVSIEEHEPKVERHPACAAVVSVFLLGLMNA